MTTASRSAWDTLEAALRQRRPVRLTYHGRQRTVSPHALGWRNDKAMLLAYQSAGKAPAGALPPGPRQGWRNLFVDDICNIAIADPATAWETAENYNASSPFNSIDRLRIAVT
ncbi:MAG: WYL domain-containing protein [Actinobacteria bacterium]|nr:WYL domain-containing protein [Actinomycetota bacterium]